MGGNESAQKEMIQFKYHERMGVYRYIQINGETFVQLHREIANENIYHHWLEKVKDVKLSMIGSDIVYLPIKHTYHKTQLCGSGGSVRLVFDQWENFLKDEISSRRKNQNGYSEQELWYILYSLVKVGLLYEGKNCKMGDMHPNNIVVTPQGFVRMITKDSLPFQSTNFEKIVEEIKADVYLAPQQMDEKMIESGMYSVKQPCKADAFSFGITMLEAITLENCSYLYIRNPLRISYEKLEGYTNIMRNSYSSNLYHTIMSVLDINPQRRKGFLQLYEMLKSYEQMILSMQPFSSIGSTVKQKSIQSLKQSINQSQFQDPNQSIQNKSIDQSGKGTNRILRTPFSPPTQQLFSFKKV